MRVILSKCEGLCKNSFRPGNLEGREKAEDQRQKNSRLPSVCTVSTPATGKNVSFPVKETSAREIV